ncbi:response regulator transcription factor [Sulfurisoma sediminicola]|uniref:LuxR family two component transcriptional regulator n=1 Tax=Sulfurisoma sediminicola TaxID=1381557 RepID=A0A497XMV2_9PROT|nr:sigma-70 family RNA polymerase sigma factor [Sulfurisoma sediminicola]RLJ68576.1 LuxR family two component transcriptional regulator [Sulfurisoma sediminicola]
MDNTVFIIDDDASVRDALGLLLGLRGYRTAFFADAASFLNAYQPDWHGCLLIDIRMPGMNGLELQQKLRDIGCGIPAVIITGHGDVSSAREAFRAEAVDFLEKPLDETRLLKAIEEAYAYQDASLQEKKQSERVAAQMAELTPREREVMELVVAGKHNRDIAVELGISARTVEVHKARLMAKLKAEGVPQLVRMTLGLNGPR